MHFPIQPKTLKVPQPSPLVTSGSSDAPERQIETMCRPRKFSLPKLPSSRSVMNLPNISISEVFNGSSRAHHESGSGAHDKASSTSPGPSEPSTYSDEHQHHDHGAGTVQSDYKYGFTGTVREQGSEETSGSASEAAAAAFMRQRSPAKMTDRKEDWIKDLPHSERMELLRRPTSRVARRARMRMAQTNGSQGNQADNHHPGRLVNPATFAHCHTPSSASDRRIPPATHLVRGDDTVIPSSDNGRPLQPIGKWRCCKCQKGHDIYNFTKGAHPVSTLNCVCTHRSCVNCTLDGLIKRFEPMNDPEVVQLSDDGLKQVRFGVFCDGCGLSWRAQEVSEELARKSALQRISALPKRLAKRGVHPLERLRYSQSMSNLSRPSPIVPLPASRSTLNLRALSNEMAKGHGKQAEVATVKFTDIQCTCGLVTDASSLCFQVVDPPKDLRAVRFAELVTERRAVEITSTPEDQAQGHGTPVLTLKGGQHVNPLMSNPITREDLVL